MNDHFPSHSEKWKLVAAIDYYLTKNSAVHWTRHSDPQVFSHSWCSVFWCSSVWPAVYVWPSLPQWCGVVWWPSFKDPSTLRSTVSAISYDHKVVSHLSKKNRRLRILCCPLYHFDSWILKIIPLSRCIQYGLLTFHTTSKNLNAWKKNATKEGYVMKRNILAGIHKLKICPRKVHRPFTFYQQGVFRKSFAHLISVLSTFKWNEHVCPKRKWRLYISVEQQPLKLLEFYKNLNSLNLGILRYHAC